jgi:hypothetical protein
VRSIQLGKCIHSRKENALLLYDKFDASFPSMPFLPIQSGYLLDSNTDVGRESWMSETFVPNFVSTKG